MIDDLVMSMSAALLVLGENTRIETNYEMQHLVIDSVASHKDNVHLPW